MAALEKFGPDISKDAEWIAKTDHAVEAAHKFDWDHVLRGEIRGGNATGFHAEQAADGVARISPDAHIHNYPNGVYQAKVQIWNANSRRWKSKSRPSSFFPADWSIARIKYEVIEAFKRRISKAENSREWVGTSPSGIEIGGYADETRVTFFPIGVP